MMIAPALTMPVRIRPPVSISIHCPSYADYVDALLAEHGQWPASDEPTTIARAARIGADALAEAYGRIA